MRNFRFSQNPKFTEFGCTTTEITTDTHLEPEECWHAVKTGRYHNKWFNLTEIRLNVPKHHTYISKGKYTASGSCTGRTYERGGQEHQNHYERSEITLLVTTHDFITETGILSNEGFDVILPLNVRMPIEKNHYIDHRFGTIIWKSGKTACDKVTGFTPKYVELYQGDVDLHLKIKTDTESKYMNSLVTVFNEKKNLKILPITFGYSIRYKTTVCGRKAFQTKYFYRRRFLNDYSPFTVKDFIWKIGFYFFYTDFWN